MTHPFTFNSWVSSTNGTRTCLTIVEAKTPNTASSMPLLVHSASSLPNRLWTTSAPYNRPRASIAPIRCLGLNSQD